MSFSLSAGVITQSGTDTNLSGLSAIAGVTTNTNAGGFTEYVLGTLRINITGTLSIGGSAAYREMLNIGTDAATTNTIINVASGGVFNIGGSATVNSITDAFPAYTLIYQPGSGKGYNESTALSMGTTAFMLVQNGATLNWKSGTLDIWGGVACGASSIANIGVSGSTTKPILNFQRAFRSGSSYTTSTQNWYVYSTSLSLYGLIAYGGVGNTDSLSGAALIVVAVPLVFTGYEPRYMGAAFAGSTSMGTGTFTIANYAGNLGGANDVYQRTGGNPSTWYFDNSAPGTSMKFVSDAAGGGVSMPVYMRQTLTPTVTTPGGTAIQGATCMLVDTSNVFYSAQTNSSGVATISGVIVGFRTFASASTPVTPTAYFGSGDSATQTILAYGYLPFQDQVILRGIGGTPDLAALVADPFVTLSEASAVTILGSNFSISGTGVGTITVTANSTLDQLYDAVKAWKTRNVQAQLQFPAISTLPVNASGTVLSTAMNIVVNTGVTLSAGTKFKTLTTTGTAAYSGTGTTTAVVTDSGGTTGVLTITLPSGSSTAVYKQDGSLYSYTASTGTTLTVYIPSTITGAYTYTVTLYGKIPITNSVTVTGGGYLTSSVTLATDAAITQTTVATVTAYTVIANPDQAYDYAAYYKTTSGGIGTAQLITKVGANALIGGALTLDSTAGSVFSYSVGTLTMKSTAIASGSTFATLGATGTLTMTGTTATTVVSGSNGATGVFTLGVPNGSSTAIYKQDGSLYSYTASTGTSLTAYIPLGVTGSYSYTVTLYGKTPSYNSILITGGGTFSDSVSLSTDSAITQPTVATVAAYATFVNPDQIYDYESYYITTSAGIGSASLLSKVGTNALVSANLVLSSSAGSLRSFSAGTLTLKSAAISAGSTFTTLSATGTLTLTGTTFSTVLSGSNGSTGVLTITYPSGASILIRNQSGTQAAFSSSGTSATVYIPLSTTGSYTYEVAQYGYLPTSGSVIVTPGGLLSDVAALVADGKVTASSVTASGYSSLFTFDSSGNLTVTSSATYDQIYDYGSYWITLSAANMLAAGFGLQLFAAVGSSQTYSKNLTVNTGVTVSAGSKFTKLVTTGTVTLSGTGNISALYSVSGSESCQFSIALPLSGMSVCVLNNSGSVIANVSGQTGTYMTSTAPGATGSWSWVIKKAGYASANGTFSPALGGVQSAGPVCPIVKNPDGSTMYQATTSSLVQISFSGTTTLYIDIGDGVAPLQAVYDMVEQALVTSSGMLWIASGKSGVTQFNSGGGDFLFMGATVRLRRWHTTDTPTLNAFAQSADGIPVDQSNGPVYFLTSDSPAAIAAAVWAYAGRSLAVAPASPTDVTNSQTAIIAAIPSAATNASAVRTNLTTELGRIDVAISTRNAVAPDNTSVAAIKAKTDNLPAAPAAVSDIPSATTTATAVRTNLTTELSRIDAAVSSRNSIAPDNASITAIKVKTDNLPSMPAAVSDIPSAAINAAAVRTNLTTELGRVDVAISSRNATAPDNTSIAAIKIKTDNLPGSPAAVSDIPGAATTAAAVRTNLTTELGRIDAAISSRNSIAPDNTSIAAIKVKTDNLPATPAAVGSAMVLTSVYDAAKTAASQSSVNAIPTAPLLASNYVIPDNVSIAAIKTKTDNLPAAPAAVSNIPTVTQIRAQFPPYPWAD